MGVAGLWDILRPASKTRSLTELSVTEGFEKNPNGVRGYRLGIDASIWFFHAEYGREGENPVLRTLFFRCATLMKSPFLPLFVFDGPKRPDIKRGKKINKTPNKLIPGMKQVVEAFGFEHRTAPGEAEAELAYLNSIGVIDGILSDDVDNFLFGATTVIRNLSNTLSGNRSNPVLNAAGKDDKNHSWVYNLSDLTTHPDVGLTRGGLILIGLMSGGDYQQGGLERCGVKTAVALARCGFGETLYTAAINLTREQLPDFLDAWRHELRHEVLTNSRGIIGRKSPALAKLITREFPDIDVLLSYVCPITSESMGRGYTAEDLTWKKEPNIAKLAATCEFYFEWGYKEAIIKRFRTVIWHSAVLRILRRAALNLDEDARRVGPSPFSTPRKRHQEKEETCGTPSKMITKYFSTLNLDENPNLGGDEEGEEEEERLIVKIHSTRNHVSTDGLLEYRLEVAPGQLVRLAESGILGTRLPDGPDEWASEGDEDTEEGGKKKGGKRVPVDPESHMRLWMPGCMVRMVEPRLVEEYEAVVEERLAKKAGKGLVRGARKKKSASTANESRSGRGGRKRIGSDEGDESDNELPSLPKKRTQKTTTKKDTASSMTSQSKSVFDRYLSSDEEDLPSLSTTLGLKTTHTKSTTPKNNIPTKPLIIDICTESDDTLSYNISTSRKRAGIRDLIKKKTSAASISTSTTGSTNNILEMNSSVTKPSTTANRNKSVKTKTTSAVIVSSSVSNVRPINDSPRRAPAPFPVAFSEELEEENTRPQHDEFFSKASSSNPAMRSPLRGRKSRDRKSSASSATDSMNDRIKKSPRKLNSQTTPSDRSGPSGKGAGGGSTAKRAAGASNSPFHRSRAASPTPFLVSSTASSSSLSIPSSTSSLANDMNRKGPKTKVLAVIEISSSDEEEFPRNPVRFEIKSKGLPLKSSIAPMPVERLPPLLAARVRAKSRLEQAVASTRKSELGNDVIDLT